MLNLEEWYAPSSKEAFCSLECLRLEGCPKLRTLPTTLLCALRKLKLVGECNEMMLEENTSLVKVIGCLQSLDVMYINKVETFPKVLLENLPSTLIHLHIDCCEKLVSLMQNLTSLKFFNISSCPRLKYLPKLVSRNNNTVMTILWIQFCYGLTSVSEGLRHLTTLEYLMIHDCPELEFLPDDFQDLTSLPHLQVSYLPQMTCLPEGLQQAAGTLENLDISWCPGLMSLPEWMDKFTSLQSLEIDNCENMKVLPDEVLHLTALRNVTICDCHPDMHRRYTKETGEDWNKIAHIPNLSITVTTEYRIKHGIGVGKRSIKCNMIPCFTSSSSSSSSSGTN